MAENAISAQEGGGSPDRAATHGAAAGRQGCLVLIKGARSVTSCLFIVDLQKGFVRDYSREIPKKVSSLQHDYDLVVASRFINAIGSAHRRLIGWTKMGFEDVESTEFAFPLREDAYIVEKTAYVPVFPEVLRLMARHGVKTVDIVGIDTDVCVTQTAVALFETEWIRPRVLTNYCASSGGPEYHEAALKILRRLIGRDQVIDADR